MVFEAEFSEKPMTNFERAATPVPDIQNDTTINLKSVGGPENTSGPGRADGSLAFEIEGRLLLLPKDHYEKSAEYFTSISSVMNASDEQVDGEYKGLRKIEVKDLLDLLFPLPPQKPVVPEPVSSVESTRDSIYYLDMVVFQVEDSLFNVPKHHFLQSSLRDSLIVTDENHDTPPIQLDGVSKTDFRAILKLLDPLSPNTTLLQDEWVSVLKLATKWKMQEPRRVAVKNLTSSLPPLERVLLGREQMVPDWLRSGYVDLARREAPLSVNEFESLGLQTALVISQKIRTRHSTPGGMPLFRPPSEDSLFTQTMNDIFRTELHEEAASLPVIDRILLARSYGVSEWLYAGLVDLGKRREDITLEEAEKLGLETTARLCQVREKLRTGQFAPNPVIRQPFGFGFSKPAPDPSILAPDPSILAAREIDTFFEGELKGVRAAAIPYGYHDQPQTARTLFEEELKGAQAATTPYECHEPPQATSSGDSTYPDKGKVLKKKKKTKEKDVY